MQLMPLLSLSHKYPYIKHLHRQDSNIIPSCQRCRAVVTGAAGARSRGFTFIELLAVMLIIALVLAVVLPRFSSVSTQNLKSDALKASSLFRYLHEAAESKKLFYRIIFDIESDTIEVERSTDSEKYVKSGQRQLNGLSFSKGVDIIDIVSPLLGTKTGGTVEILLSPYGGSVPFTLHLGAGESMETVQYNPYTGAVTVEEGYR